MDTFHINAISRHISIMPQCLQLASPALPRKTRPGSIVVKPRYHKSHPRLLNAPATTAIDSSASTAADDSRPLSSRQVQGAKQALLNAIAGTQRGSDAGSLQRGQIAEAQVAVEAFSPVEVDWSLLPGTWNVVYTTAADVLPIVRPGAGLPGFPLRVGRVGQRFTSPDEGIVQNLIEVEALVPFLTGTKATLVVEASYEVRTSRSIALSFKKAGVGQVLAGDDLQNILATPLLPRGDWQMQALLAISEFSAFLPLTTRVSGTSSSSRTPAGLNYNITYLDEDMFIGRAGGNGGTFIFVRDQNE
jgi:PAP_fibrillin